MDRRIIILISAIVAASITFAVITTDLEVISSETDAANNEIGQTFELNNFSYEVKSVSSAEANGSVIITGYTGTPSVLTIPLTVINGGNTYDVDEIAKNVFFNQTRGIFTGEIVVELTKTNETISLSKTSEWGHVISDTSVYSDAFGNKYFKEYQEFDDIHTYCLFESSCDNLVIGTSGFTGSADSKISIRLGSNSDTFYDLTPKVDISSAVNVFISAGLFEGIKLPLLTNCTELNMAGHALYDPQEKLRPTSTYARYGMLENAEAIPVLKSVSVDYMAVEVDSHYFIPVNTSIEEVWIGDGTTNLVHNNKYSLLDNSKNLKTAIVEPGNQYLENDAIGNVVNKATKAIIWEKPLPFEMTVAEGEITPGQLNFNVDVTKKTSDGGLDDVRLLIIAKYGFGDNSGIFTNLTQKVVFDVDGKSSNVVSVSELGLSGVSVVLINGAPMGEFKTYGSWEYPDNKGA